MQYELLEKNEAFKTVILDGYLKEYANRIQEKINDCLFTGEKAEELNNIHIAILGFKQFLKDTKRSAQVAKQALDQHKNLGQQAGE